MNSTTLQPPKRSSVLLWIGAFLFLFGAIFGSVGVYVFQLEREYLSDGESAEGTIVSKRIEERWSTDSSTKRKTKTIYYYINYKFSPAAGPELESSSSVSSETYSKASEGSSVEIQYLRASPTTNRIAQDPDFVFGAVFTGIGLLVISAGVALIGYEIKKRRLASRLLQNGIAVDATIQSVGPGSMTINDVEQWLIKFSFVDFYGHTHSGTSDHLAPSAAQHWKAGERGKVLYDKSDPKQHIWVGC